MKRGTKICIAVGAALLIIGEAIQYFRVESWTLAWHVRHGFHTEFGDLRLRVPFSYEANDPDGLPWLTVIHYPRRMRQGLSYITVDFTRQPSAEKWRSAQYEDFQEKLGLKKVGERPMALAGRSGECFEYIVEPSGTQETARQGIGGTGQIFCFFGDVGVKFLGTPSLEDEFYGFIRAAEPIQRKN